MYRFWAVWGKGGLKNPTNLLDSTKWDTEFVQEESGRGSSPGEPEVKRGESGDPATTAERFLRNADSNGLTLVTTGRGESALLSVLSTQSLDP